MAIVLEYGTGREPVSRQNESPPVVTFDGRDVTPVSARESLHRALDELIDAHAAERVYVSESADRLPHLSADEQVAIFNGVKPYEDRLQEATNHYRAAYEAAVMERLGERQEPEERILVALATPQSIGVNLSLHRAEADTCTRQPGCWRKVAHPDDAGKDDTDWCSDCERPVYHEAQL